MKYAAPGIRPGRRHILRAAGGLAAGALASPWICRGAFGAEEVLKIGWIRPTTGRLASSFAPLYEGGLIAIDEINAAGGVLGRKLVIQEEDDEASPANAPAVMQKLRDAGVRYVVGPTGSSQSLAALPFGTEAKMIQHGIANSGELGNAEKYPYSYQLLYTTEQEGRVGATYMVERLKAKRIGILHEETAFGAPLAAASAAAIRKFTGKDPAAVQSFQIAATDLSVQVRKLRDADCDGLLVWASSNVHIGMAFNLMAQMNFLPPTVGHVNLFNEALYQQVPPESLENVYAVYYRNWTFNETEAASPRCAALAKKFAERPSLKPIQAYIAGTPQYDFVYLIKMGIETANSFDPDAVKHVLDNTRGFKGLVGTFSFSPTNHAGLPDEDIVMARVYVKGGGSSGAIRPRAPGF